MAIVLARIDDRFIHGQVTVGWSQKLRPQRIVLCNDEIAADPWQSRVYRASVPPHIKVSILSGAETAAALLAVQGGPVDGPRAEEKTILLAGSPADMHALLTEGLALGEVNVGGMHYTDGKVALLPYVYVDRTDVDVFRSFLQRGVRLVARQVPGGREVTLDEPLLAAVEARL
jgi:mannose/fructose/N-acetylgalactosamine-specific phosphotransferase system component IIB